MKRAAASIDPITANVIGGALETIAVEMGFRLMRMSHSSLIRESEDFGAAVMDAEGNQIAETPQSTPLQSGPLPGYVRGIRAALQRRGEAIEPGDVYIHNDAYGGASHVPDVAFCVPVFHEGALVGFTATAAHHVDIGAHTPGQRRHCRCGRRVCGGHSTQGSQDLRQGGQEHDALGGAGRQYPRIPPGAGRYGGADRSRPDGRRGLSPPDRAPRSGCGAGGLHRAHGLFRAYDAPGHRDAPGRTLLCRGRNRRLPGRRRPGAPRTPHRGHGDRCGQRHHGRFHRHGGTGGRPAHQHAAPRHGRLRGLDDTAIDPAGFRGARPDTAQRRANPADPISWRRRGLW